MSVYIKGMEMPTNAEGCEVIIRIQPNGEVLDLHGFHIGATAIPVPDHGRLIDADALCKTLRNLAENEYTPTVFANWIEHHIDTIEVAEWLKKEASE